MSKVSFVQKVFGEKGKYSNSTKEILFFCPFCNHHKPKLSINLETDMWQCFPCGKRGRSLIVLMKKLGSLNYIDEYIQYYKPKDIRLKNSSGIDFHLKLPDEYRCLYMFRDSILVKKAWKYLERRGLTEVDILRNKIGVCFGGEYADRIILPSFDCFGSLNYFTSRSFDGHYLNPITPKGYKNEIIINELNIDWTQPLTIVEGFFDLFKCNRNTTALLGSNLSTYSRLFEKIVLNDTPVILALDADAVLKSIYISKMLMSYGIKVKNLDVNPFGDVGEMSKKEFQDKYKLSSNVTEEVLIREKMRSILNNEPKRCA